MADVTAPGAPSLVSAIAISPTDIALMVNTPFDDVGVTSYKVYNGGVLLASPTGAAPPSGVGGLTPNTTYVLTVTALDAALNESQPSNMFTVTTRPGSDTAATAVIVGLAGLRGQCEIDFGATPIAARTFVVADTNVDVNSRVIAQTAYEAPPDKDLDELEFDTLEIVCAPGAGQFTMRIRSTDGTFLADKFKVNYVIVH